MLNTLTVMVTVITIFQTASNCIRNWWWERIDLIDIVLLLNNLVLTLIIFFLGQAIVRNEKGPLMNRALL
jgi:hypothetical protein